MPKTFALPTTLNDRYVIERELDRSMVATAFLAQDLAAERPVVINVLDPELAQAAGERFPRQIAVIARLEHPNILPVIDFGRGREVDGGDEFVYYVTPYVEGEELSARLQRGRQLPLDEALRIVGGVAAALDFAHRRRVVHGNISPSSILLHQGEAFVIDFAEVAMRDWDGKGNATRDDLVIGDITYKSPELWLRQVLDARSDEYSLASILYEMLSGQPLFSSGTPLSMVKQVVEAPPRRLTTLRVVPRVVERAIERALSKSPAERFPTVGDFVAALHGAGTPASLPARPTPPAAPRRRWRVALVTSLVVLTVGAGVAMASRAVMGRRPTSAVGHRQLTFTGAATLPDLSPDGRAVTYVAGGRSLLVQGLDGGDPVALVAAARSITGARWTGDGRGIVVSMTRDSTERPATFFVPATGGPARKVLEDARPYDAGPDSTVIVRAAHEAGRIEIVSLDSGEVTRTITLTGPVGPIGEIAWSPDRRWIAFTSAKNGALWVVAADGGLPNRLASGARTIRWAGGSDAIYFLSGPVGTVDLVRIGIDPRSGASTGKGARVTSLLAADGFDVGRDGRLVHTQTSRGADLRTFVLGGTGAARRVVDEQSLDEGTGRLDGASVSPDGRWVAYSAAQGADRDIHVVAFGGGSARVVAGSPALEDGPAWSLDGSRLTFARQDSIGRVVILADARTGVGQRVGSLRGPGVPGSGARWSASGRHIAYYARDRRRIVLVNFQRRNESIIRLPEYVGAADAVVLPSPNGTQLVAMTRVGPDDQLAMWLVFGNGRRWRRIRGPFGESFPIAWHRNGWIYLVRNRALATDHGAVHVELWRMRGPNGLPELVTALPEGCGLSVSISADASRGVCDYNRVESDLYVASSFGTSGR